MESRTSLILMAMNRENRLLFYYAGHGHTQERNGRKFGYLVPADAPNPFENEKVFYRKSLKMEQVISWSKQIESKHALFVFDSCFSGSVLQSRAVTVPEDNKYLTNVVLTVESMEYLGQYLKM